MPKLQLTVWFFVVWSGLVAVFLWLPQPDLQTIGAVLTQVDLNGNQHPVSFISKTLSPTERNYKIYDQELLAIIQALEEW